MTIMIVTKYALLFHAAVLACKPVKQASVNTDPHNKARRNRMQDNGMGRNGGNMIILLSERDKCLFEMWTKLMNWIDLD